MRVLPARPVPTADARARVLALRRGPAGPVVAGRGHGAADAGPPGQRGDGAAGVRPRAASAPGGWVPDVRRRRRLPARSTGPAPAGGHGGPLDQDGAGADRGAGTGRDTGDADGASGDEAGGDGASGDGASGDGASGDGASGDGVAAGCDTGDPSDAPAEPEGGTEGAWAARLVRQGPWGALAQRWVPEPMRGARVGPGRRGAVLLSVVAALAAVIAAVGVWWGRPQPRPVTPVALAPVAQAGPATQSAPAAVPGSTARLPALGAGAHRAADGTAAGGWPAAGGTAAGGGPATASGGSPDATAAASSTGPVVVSVTGRVRHPGLVTVPAGARVADAIAAAGGALDAADLTGLNLATRLSDGDSVVVAGPQGSSLDLQAGRSAGSRATTGARSDPGPIDINTADVATLTQLPGVGPVTAAAIVAWRSDHGPFTSVEQLQAVSGIGPAKYAQISPHVTV